MYARVCMYVGGRGVVAGRALSQISTLSGRQLGHKYVSPIFRVCV